MAWLTDPQIWAILVTLTALEIVLGIDNLVFIAIVAGRLPPERQNRARQVGLALALITRLGCFGQQEKAGLPGQQTFDRVVS